MKIVILGSGIGSLSAAYYLAKQAKYQITLIQGPKKGGWIESKQSQDVLLELGPRSLRPFGIAGSTTLELIHELGLESKVISVPGSHPAAQNRFIYNQGMINLSSNPFRFLKSNPSLFLHVLNRIMMEPFQPSASRDETIESFISRRFGKRVAFELFSAMIHGIYAGDISKLSIQSTFPTLYEYEKQYGSIVKGILYNLKKQTPYIAKNQKAQDFIDSMSKHKMYSFSGGLQTFSDCLYEKIKQLNVQVIQDSCTELEFGPNRVVFSKGVVEADKVISGIPSTKLAQIIPKTKQYHRMKELLNSIQGVDVVVVNLVYEPGVITEPGFGFLIPKQSDIQGPILGVIYDSCVFPQSNKTVCTVMMGGSKFRENEMWSKTSQEWTDLAIESMTRILGISSSKLITSNTTLQSKCIPQYTVDHRNRVDELMGYQNHLYLVGSSYQGVGINDIICNSYRTVQNYF